VAGIGAVDSVSAENQMGADGVTGCAFPVFIIPAISSARIIGDAFARHSCDTVNIKACGAVDGIVGAHGKGPAM